MFVRKWSSLPADLEFPSDLETLGYFINKDDEVRMIENEDNYFKFFISRNGRWNVRQRFAMNQAIQDEIHKRLEKLGLTKQYLPLGASPGEPRVPILISKDISTKKRIVIICGESFQDLGALAHRVIGGPGGINKGSLVNPVMQIQAQQSTPTDPSPPGILLANLGELIYWPTGDRTLSANAFDGAPMRSAAHRGNYIDPKVNHVPMNESPGAHVKYIFEHVVPLFVDPDAGLDVIGLGDGADVVTAYLNSDGVWDKGGVGQRINCFASVGGCFPEWDVKCDGLRAFLKDRTRAFVPAPTLEGLILSGPSGNPNTKIFTDFGCPVISTGPSKHVETLFIDCQKMVLNWLQEVALTPEEEKPYLNPEFTVFHQDTDDVENAYWDGWKEDIEEGEKNVGGEGKVTQDGVLEELGHNDDAKETNEKNGQVPGQNGRNKHVVRDDSESDSEDEVQGGPQAAEPREQVNVSQIASIAGEVREITALIRKLVTLGHRFIAAMGQRFGSEGRVDSLSNSEDEIQGGPQAAKPQEQVNVSLEANMTSIETNLASIAGSLREFVELRLGFLEAQGQGSGSD